MSVGMLISPYMELKQQYGDGTNPKISSDTFTAAFDEARKSGSPDMENAINMVKDHVSGVDLNGAEQKTLYNHFDSTVSNKVNEILNDSSNKNLKDSPYATNIQKELTGRNYTELGKDIKDPAKLGYLKPSSTDTLKRISIVGDLIHTYSTGDIQRATNSYHDYISKGGTADEFKDLTGMDMDNFHQSLTKPE